MAAQETHIYLHISLPLQPCLSQIPLCLRLSLHSPTQLAMRGLVDKGGKVQPVEALPLQGLKGFLSIILK